MPGENPSIAEGRETRVGERDFVQGVGAAGPKTSESILLHGIL